MRRILFQLISTNYKYTVGQYSTKDSKCQSDVKAEQKATGYLQDSTRHCVLLFPMFDPRSILIKTGII